MSLLPKQIIPPTTPIGTLQPDGTSVLVDKNWWLFLYNIYLNTIGGGGNTDDSALLAKILFPSDPPTAGAPAPSGGADEVLFWLSLGR